MQLSNKREISTLLENGGFTFKKSLGQNFLIDPSVCPEMAKAACDGETGVLEIGPGAGVLTAELAQIAKRVVAVELDERLRPVLQKTLAGFGNIELVFGDAMKLDLATLMGKHFSDCARVTVCANLPYYITSPLIMKLLESRLPIESLTVMVQKEAAERLCAEVGTREAGAVTVAVRYYAESRILFEVPRESFMPSPKVDSAVIQLKICEQPPVVVKDETWFFKVVKACFAQRRKTLCNTVSNTLGIEKAALLAALAEMELPADIRSEKLTLGQLAELSDRLVSFG